MTRSQKDATADEQRATRLPHLAEPSCNSKKSLLEELHSCRLAVFGQQIGIRMEAGIYQSTYSNGLILSRWESPSDSGLLTLG